MSGALQHQDIDLIWTISGSWLSLSSEATGMGKRILTAAFIPTSMAGARWASCQPKEQSPRGEGWALPIYSHSSY